jgi:hypothetical protein
MSMTPHCAYLFYPIRKEGFWSDNLQARSIWASVLNTYNVFLRTLTDRTSLYHAYYNKQFNTMDNSVEARECIAWIKLLNLTKKYTGSKLRVSLLEVIQWTLPANVIQHYPHQSLTGCGFHLKESPAANRIQIRNRARKKVFTSDRQNIKKLTKSFSFLMDSWFMLLDNNSTIDVLSETKYGKTISIKPVVKILQFTRR